MLPFCPVGWKKTTSKWTSRGQTRKTGEAWRFQCEPGGTGVSFFSVNSRGRYKTKMAAAWDGWQRMDSFASYLRQKSNIHHNRAFRLVGTYATIMFALSSPLQAAFSNFCVHTRVYWDAFQVVKRNSELQNGATVNIIVLGVVTCGKSAAKCSLSLLRFGAGTKVLVTW